MDHALSAAPNAVHFHRLEHLTDVRVRGNGDRLTGLGTELTEVAGSRVS